MKKEIENLKKQIEKEMSQAQSAADLRQLENKYFSRKGEFSLLMKKIKDVDESEKKQAGQLANQAKKELFQNLDKAKDKLSRSDQKNIDMTLPGDKIKKGHLNPLTLVQNELEEIFKAMGFMVLEGPELESDYYCFEALNIPKHHPARDMQDTFYVDIKNKKNEYDLVMRTHTSPMQVRAMQKYGAPLRCIVPGRTFRSEALDACHEHTFDQLEGLMIGKDISLSNLIAVMKELLSGIFQKEMEVRVRPGYFPFVEPGIELDIKCAICAGDGCSSCKHSGWLEILPAGMVHPEVLRYGGIDPDQYSGFAFGLGLTRLVMMKYGIGDIRLINSGDLRFLEQF